jgi:Fic family protein
MTKLDLPTAIHDTLASRTARGLGPAGADDITRLVAASRSTINRYLAKMTASGEIVRTGTGRGTMYGLPLPQHLTINTTTTHPWSIDAKILRAQLDAPLSSRQPVSYQRRFVDRYVPNQSSLLPHELADSLHAKGRVQGQQPAGTYARKVLEQLLIDLSWYSSRLEGNRISLLDTRELFIRGRSANDDLDATMLLNHKDTIEFIVDAAPEYGITVAVVRNVQSLLMQGLLENPYSLGAIRKTVVNITGSVYVPTQVPSLLEEMLEQIVGKARQINNPLEAAFFLWVNIAYLQPFEDGNKRTSRLCANLPLMLANCAPLSFLDVDASDYAVAMLGVYERLDVTLAIELFDWTYRRAIDKYRAILDAMGAPDRDRARFREHLGEAVRQVIGSRSQLSQAVAAQSLNETDEHLFRLMLEQELQHLEPWNCARYRLPIGKTEDWIRDGRPM